MEIDGRLATSLADRYEIERELGHGGAASVYLAKDRKLQRHVAIKVLHPDLADSIAAERFVREIQIEAELEHPNIVSLHDAGTADGLPYCVIAYVEGGSLRDHLIQKRQLPVEEALHITCDVADALAHAHQHGFVHRDVKPENILSSNGHWLVADFGIARAIAKAGDEGRTTQEMLTSKGIVIGTPEYMSPEQATGDQPDARTDVYSLACVLFEMLAGEPPFTGLTPQSVIARQVNERIPSVEVVRPGLPPGIAISLERALSKVAADRYQSVEEFRTALESCDEVRRLSQGVRKRREYLPTSVGLGFGALIVAALWFFWPRSDLPPLDPTRVLVFPMRESNFSVLPEESGRFSALAIGTALEHIEPLKFDWGEKWLDDESRADIALLDAPMGDSIARARGAGFWIEGEILEQDPLAIVTLWLHDVEGDSVMQHTETGRADTDSLRQLSLNAGFELLASIVHAGDFDREVFLEHDLGASALWMQGESEYRAAHFDSALGFYQRAIAKDPSLAMAAIRGAQAASWSYRLDDAADLLAVALTGETVLPARYVELAQGLWHYYTGSGDSAVHHIRAALDLDPAWTDAWMALGETYTHLLPQVGPLDSLAAVAFTTARRLDREFSPPLFHLFEIALRDGDITGADTLLEAFRSTVPDTALARTGSVMFDCVTKGPESVAWEELVTKSPRPVFDAATGLAPRMAHPECAEAGWRATYEFEKGEDGWAVNRRWSSLLGMQTLFLVQGRFDEALELLTSAPWVSSAKLTGLLDVAAGAPFEQEAATWAVELLEREVLSSSRMWFLAVWGASQRDADWLAPLADEMRARADSSGEPYESMLAKSFEAFETLARGDSLRALAMLETIRPTVRNGIAWSPWHSLPVVRLTEARLQLAFGRYEDAIATAAEFDATAPTIYLAFLPASLEVRLEAAEKLGDQHLVDEVKRRLDKLTRGQ